MAKLGSGPGHILALCLVMVVALAACSGSPEKPFQPTFQGGPRLSLDRSTLDFGDVPPGKPLEAAFHLRNVGDGPLLIERAFTRVVEGCCPPQPELETMEIVPGETSALSLSFTMAEGMPGLHLFEVVVFSNDPVEPEARLTVRAMLLES